MYKLLESIPRTKSFAILNRALLLADSNVVRGHNIEGEILNSEQNLQNLKVTDEQAFVNTNDGAGYLLSDTGNQSLNCPIQFVSYPYLLSFRRENENKNSIIKNIEDVGFEKRILGSSTIFNISNKKYFRWNPSTKIIEVFEFPTAQPLWQFDVESLGTYTVEHNTEIYHHEVHSFIGVINNLIFVKLQANEILTLNINDGKLVKRLSLIDDFIGTSITERTKDNIPYFSTKYIIDEQRSCIYALLMDLLYEIKVAETVHSTVYGLQDVFSHHGINHHDISTNNILQGDKLYFMSREQGRFVVLDIPSKKIEFVSEPIIMTERPDVFTKLREIQVSKDKVYVLANDNTLHIFQRES